MTPRGRHGLAGLMLAGQVAVGSPALACSRVPVVPPPTEAQLDETARARHADAYDLLELRMARGTTAGRPGTAVVARALKGRYPAGTRLTVTTTSSAACGFGDIGAGRAFRAYAPPGGTVSYRPLSSRDQARLLRLGLVPRSWGVRGP